MRFMTNNVAWWLLALPLSAAVLQPAAADDGGKSDKHSPSLGFTGVPAAQPRVANAPAPDALTPELIEVVVAQGSHKLENPTSAISHYGYHADGPLLPAYGDTQSATHNVEATKSEPDKNTYLVLDGQKGADANYNYGTHFLFQGHELAPGYITRVNLDADAAHRVTLLASQDASGTALPAFDGSTWNPHAKRLLFTSENGNKGGVWQATLDVPSKVEDISGALGRGGYEGIQADSDGNVWIVEDVGGPKGTTNKNARQPNSFLYRFVPANKSDLTKGKLQALQVKNKAGQPIVFHAGQADADITSTDSAELRTYGNALETSWITLHDTAVDGNAPFDANALAKAKLATPFKRPENGVFRPGTGFAEFYFDETGDTDSRTEAGSKLGGFGSIFKLQQQDGPSANAGKLSIVYQGDVVHSAFDNCGFWDKDHVVFVEDAGDTLHGQRNALDSAWLFDLTVDYANPNNQPLRLLAQGRDSAATVDTTLSGQPGFQNDGDNEITGFHVSNGDASPNGLLGAAQPRPFKDGWRVFYTQQHGDNRSYEILPNNGARYDD